MRSAVCLCALMISGVAAGQPLPDYGMQWRTVGAAGNAPLAPGDGYAHDRPIGAVGYEFRMAQTEVTHVQYLEFLVAYTAAFPSAPVDITMTGPYIARVSRPGGYQWVMPDSLRQCGAEMGFNYAAMYCNWLHNEKGTQPSAFLTGAYDASTFFPSPAPQGVNRLPGAKFWLPNLDEWTKGMYFDPNKHGAGQPGYWMYPTSSDSPPIGGAPGTPGAQTGAGIYEPMTFRDWPVGSYPGAQSPWGLLDGSGGIREWCDGSAFNEFLETRGTTNSSTTPFLDDRVDQVIWNEFRAPSAGIRIAGLVPTPPSMFAFCCILTLGLRRRSRYPAAASPWSGRAGPDYLRRRT